MGHDDRTPMRRPALIATDEPATIPSLRIASKHRYVMMFRANRMGLAKRVELWANDPNEALELALADQSQRTVDVWEDGDFICRLSRTKNRSDENGAGGHVR